jgi:hypothetical protein
MLEPDIVATAAAELAKTAQIDPSWWLEYEHTETDICSRAELLSLLETAPTPMARGVIFGKWLMRIEIENVTGRPFL